MNNCCWVEFITSWQFRECQVSRHSQESRLRRDMIVCMFWHLPYCVVLHCVWYCGTVVHTHLTPNSSFPSQTLSSTLIWMKSIEGFVFFVFLMQTSDKRKVVWSPETKRLMSCCNFVTPRFMEHKMCLKERPWARRLQCRWVNTG